MSYGPKHGPQGQKKTHLASKLRFFPGPRNEREGSPIIFQGFLGCTEAPQTTQSPLVSVCGSTEFFGNGTRFRPVFGFRYSETSTRYSFSSTENGLVFLGLNNIFYFGITKGLHFNRKHPTPPCFHKIYILFHIR